MPLNKASGNMYPFIDYTWNTVKGRCFHDCAYCYMKTIRKRFKLPDVPAYFDETELETNLGEGLLKEQR